MKLSLSKKRSSRELAAAAVTAATSSNRDAVSLQNGRSNSDNSNDNDDSNEPSTSRTALKRRRLNEEAHHSQRGSSSSASLSLSQLESVNRCGKILRIRLTNFMCHARLDLELHPRINFLIGSNGSGKSAILAALVVGLGARAKATNRSDNVKRLIKNGESSAEIEITISNSGPEGYESERYGDRIIVVRRITLSSNTYAIKDARGRVVTNKSEDLHKILLYHNIQVDNPVFILNQDNTREFLKELDPAKNYKLFLKATQIEMILESLNYCTSKCKDQEQHIRYFEEELKGKENEINKSKDKLKQLLSVANLKDIVRRKEIEHLWSFVTAHENNLKELLEEVTEYEAKRNKLLRLVHEKDAVESELTHKIQQFESDLSVKSGEYRVKNELSKKLRNQQAEIMQRRQEINSDIENLDRRISHLNAQIEDLESNIAERLNNNMGDVTALRQSHQAQLLKFRSDEKETLAMLDSVKRDYKIFWENKNRIDEDKRNFTSRIEFEKRTISDVNAKINTLRNQSKDKLSIFGENAVRLVAEIRRLHAARKFDEMPIGPVGSYIEVPDVKYRDVVESQLGNLLDAFIVSTTRDREVLNNILKSKFPNYRPSILTSKFSPQVYNVQQGRVPSYSGAHLLLDVIKCNQPVVMNCLIDQLRIETILITDTKELAEHLTAHQENVPRNLQKVVVLKPSMEYYPDPNYRLYSLKMRPARFIQVNVQQRITQLQMDIKDCEQRINEYKQKLAESIEQFKDNSTHLRDKRALLDQLEAKQMELQENINELESYEYPEHNELDILKEDLANHKRKIDEYLKKKSEKKVVFDDLEDKMNHIKRDLIEHEKTMRTIKESIDRIQNNSDGVKTELHNMSNIHQRNQQRLNEQEEAIKKLQEAKCTKEKEMNEAIAKASAKGERVASSRSSEEILEEIKRLKARINVQNSNNEDPEKLRNIIEALEHKLQLERITYDNQKLTIMQLRKAREARFKFVFTLKRHMALMLHYSFLRILRLRQFMGKIEVSHEEKKINIAVIPHDSHLKDAVSNTKSLSGGERSYTTVAFLISLWSCVDHPFFVLDEYDVFTDEVNREYMTKLLLNEGEKHPNRQYVFLTPLDMAIDSRDYIRIHSLAAPNSG